MPEPNLTAVFREFCTANTFADTVKAFEKLVVAIGLKPSERCNIYSQVKSRIDCGEANKFFRTLDARINQAEYGGGKICQNKNILVIGGGPCGLRTAIECALLGAHVVVVEKRNYATRNNVLHLWPTATKDIKDIGGKVWYPKFCAGSIHHVSIRRLQLILMKTALLLGIEIHSPATFEEVIQPDPVKKTGWRARTNPSNCPVNNMEFQAIIGADGKRNTLDFPRKFTRGKVSIAITANFKNPGNGLHTRVSEIPGVILVRRPELFQELRSKTSVEFENLVYFRDETHYFIMTAKKKSLVEKGIIKKETADIRAMLHPSNVDQKKLLESVTCVAETAWRVDNPSFTSLPELNFELDRYGKEDVAIFDFAALHQAEHSCLVKERHGHRLLMCIVGDTLLEPFWPTGSGIAKGFLGCLDAAWLIRNWFIGSKSDLEVIAERESVFRVLPQASPENLIKDNCTIDPKSRYGGTHYGGRLPLETVKPKDVHHLYNTSDVNKRKSCVTAFQQLPKEKRRLYRGGSIDTHRLVSWFKDRLAPYAHLVKVQDLAKSWNDGLALCCLIQTERPDLMDVNCLDKHNCKGNIMKAFDIIEQKFGVEQMMAPEDLAKNEAPDRLTMMSYLFHIYEYIMTNDGTESKVPKIERCGTVDKGLPSKSSAFSLLASFANPAILLRTLKQDAQRIHDLDITTLTRTATMAGGLPGGIDYYLKTASLDRKAKSKVHMAVRRTKTVKVDQLAARKWRKKTQEKHRKRLPSYEQQNNNNTTEDSKENEIPPKNMQSVSENIGPRNGVQNNKETASSSSEHTHITKQSPEEDNEGNRPIRRGVTFTEETKMDDGPTDPVDPDLEEEKKRMMSLPRQACGGVASKAIMAFKALEIKEDSAEDEEPPPRSPSIIRRTAFRGSADLTRQDSKSPLKRRTAFRNSSQEKQTIDEEKGSDTLKRTGDVCCICNKKLYLVERHSAQGYFLHRHCFKCNHCSTNLRVGNYVLIPDKEGNPKFYCCAHAYISGALDVNWTGPTEEESKDDDTLKATDTLDQDYCGPLTEDELQYFESDEDSDDYEALDDIVNTNLKYQPNRDEALTLKRILGELDDKDSYRDNDLSDLCSDVTDTSNQLLQQEEIQQGLEELEEERDELEEKGVKLEKKIRGEDGDRPSSRSEDDLLDDWLNVTRKKQELKEKESKLMLQLRLMSIQERLRAMLDMMAAADEQSTEQSTDHLEDQVNAMEAMTDKMEKAAMKEDLSEMMTHMVQMKSFLNVNESGIKQDS